MRANGGRERKGKSLSGSYTVEASLVMSFTLFFIAALLTGIFQVHSRVVGNFVLQESLERLVYQEGGKNEEEISREEERRLRTFFWCGKAVLEIKEEAGRVRGRVEAAEESEISVKTFDPETFLRILRAAGV